MLIMKFTTTLFVLLITTFGFSQMTVTEVNKPETIGKVGVLGLPLAEITKSGRIMTFTYRDDKFSKIDNYKSFIFFENDMEKLYKLFLDFDGKEKGDAVQVNTEDGGTLQFTYKKTLGQWYAEVLHQDRAGNVGQLRWLTKKQLDILFGKEK